VLWRGQLHARLLAPEQRAGDGCGRARSRPARRSAPADLRCCSPVEQLEQEGHAFAGRPGFPPCEQRIWKLQGGAHAPGLLMGAFWSGSFWLGYPAVWPGDHLGGTTAAGDDQVQGIGRPQGCGPTAQTGIGVAEVHLINLQVVESVVSYFLLREKGPALPALGRKPPSAPIPPPPPCRCSTLETPSAGAVACASASPQVDHAAPGVMAALLSVKKRLPSVGFQAENEGYKQS
jgi:hypothetical protein